MELVILLVCLAASTAGAVAGFGGGIIIKPVLDLMGVLPVSTVSFLSACTVLSMAVVSLARTRASPVKLQLRISTPLAIGAIIGGVVGKGLFELLSAAAANERVLGAIQSVCLLILMILVFLYVLNKDKMPSYHLENIVSIVTIGAALGLISSFLGIGGGPYNLAVLFFFFSMDAKTAAKNSIYIILFSQIASIVTAVAGHSVPEFTWLSLALMIAGGVGGALLGAAVSRRISIGGVEKLLRVLMVAILCIDLYNVLKFTMLV